MFIMAKDRQSRCSCHTLDTRLHCSIMSFMSYEISTMANITETSLSKYVFLCSTEKKKQTISSISECGYIFCSNCTNYFKLIPQLNLTTPVRVCYDCFTTIDDTTNPTIESTRTTTPIAIQSGGCRQSNSTPNGSFSSPGGQKVKG